MSTLSANKTEGSTSNSNIRSLPQAQVFTCGNKCSLPPFCFPAFFGCRPFSSWVGTDHIGTPPYAYRRTCSGDRLMRSVKAKKALSSGGRRSYFSPPPPDEPVVVDVEFDDATPPRACTISWSSSSFRYLDNIFWILSSLAPAVPIASSSSPSLSWYVTDPPCAYGSSYMSNANLGNWPIAAPSAWAWAAFPSLKLLLLVFFLLLEFVGLLCSFNSHAVNMASRSPMPSSLFGLEASPQSSAPQSFSEASSLSPTIPQPEESSTARRLAIAVGAAVVVSVSSVPTVLDRQFSCDRKHLTTPPPPTRNRLLTALSSFVVAANLVASLQHSALLHPKTHRVRSRP
mmetsp:Transcript_12421/g.35545  ORF Transcript_12421/g.35545 Transcript_12421/m.35545 type:complete len:343 (-) Transcript_12421:280-1308(-)